ncbi:MAG: tetratricopeptide repeat protein [Blastocatellia bacterium]|nr:tetratricopeptide repeat protein [Blastocatellia bacterium]
MTQPREDRATANRQSNEVGLRDITILLMLLLFISLAAMMPWGEVYGRTGNLMRQSTQELVGAGNEGEFRVLEREKPIRRELTGGEQHRYQVRLIADSTLKLVVEQQGIDVVVQVSGPDGKQILEFDSESRPEGPESVSLVAEVTGGFRLMVRPREKCAAAGKYEIRIEEVRPATDTDRALHDARKQYEEARKLREAGKYGEALPLAERVLEIRERFLGAEHPDVAVAIDSLASIYIDRGDYGKAEPLYLRALELREKALGKDHPLTATSLNHLAELYESQGKYGEAEPLFKRALDIEEKALDKDHPNTADTLNGLAILYYYQGKYREAEALYKRALEIYEKALGKDHPDTAECLNDLALNYEKQGKYAEAEPLFKRALEIIEKARGEDHPSTVDTLNNLAGLYYYLGKYAEAEPLYKRALAICEKSLGKDHPLTATSLNNLAFFYKDQWKYVEAEPLFKRALDIFEKTLGKDHPDTAASLDNLAMVYYKQGKYAEAEPLFKRDLDISEKALGKDHPDTAICLNNMAGLYERQGKYEEAERFYRRALDIDEKALGKDHPETATGLDNLALNYEKQGKYAEAESLFKRALDIDENALGKDHLFTATSLNNLAGFYENQGKYAEAEPLSQRALAIWEKKLGKDHPLTALSLNNLATLYTAKGDLGQAVKFQARAVAASELNLARNLVIGSEREKLAYLAALPELTDQTISLHLRSAPADPVARNLAATMILQRKGRVLDATSQNLNALRSRFNAEDQALLDRLIETRSQIARLVLRGQQQMTVERYRSRIKELEDQAEKDETEISQRSSEFRVQYLPVTLEDVRAAIPPPDSALIEFAAYRPFNARATKGEKAYGPPRYVAYILRRVGEIEWKELGDAKRIDQEIAVLRKALRDPARLDFKRLARGVDAQVFRPLRPLLGGVRRLLISPDGALNLIPFEALVDEQGRYAVERYSISYLTSGRDLLRMQVARESKDGPLLVAAPDFGRRSQVVALRSGKQEKDAEELEVKEEATRSALEDIYFKPLPGAAAEGEALRALLPNATLLTRRHATKAALNQVRGPRLLHIATHGFFLEDQQLNATDRRGYQLLRDSPARFLDQVEEREERIENPLLRSGLVLAGANEHREEDNGILTALEVTGLNLWGTKLVVLSACDTGVGEVKNGDGVYGLRRALVLAGAETQLMSLWAVSDKATRELMVSYYRRLLKGEGRGEALRQVKLEMLKRADRRHPFYWASFIQSGEWTSLVVNEGGKYQEQISSH